MSTTQAREEYIKAQKMGLKEIKEYAAAGKPTNPAVLDDILPSAADDIYKEVGLVEIPVSRVVGTKSAGRITAFSPTFLPLLGEDSEFGIKWRNLCDAHMSDEGIREPILCYEYLGEFYIQEGNKRLSVMRYFGASRIPGNVRRIMPQPSEDPRVKAYYEFLEFYKDSGIYEVLYKTPGDYAKLLERAGKKPGEKWSEWERRNFTAYFQYFREAYEALGGNSLEQSAEEALLVWLNFHTFQELGELSGAKLKKSLSDIWNEFKAHDAALAFDFAAAEVAPKTGILGLFNKGMSHVNVAFIHQMDETNNPWVQGHEAGRRYLETQLGDKVTCKSYFHANTKEDARELLDQAVAEGAQVVFTTHVQLNRQTLKAAVRHPKVKFLNCSVNVRYSSVRSYYSRMYEGKFVAGAIAGAMANNDKIGYIGSCPTYGETASINAFALGAQMTNPRARIDLRWSCLPGEPSKDFAELGYQVVSNRNVPTADRTYLAASEYGTWAYLEDGTQVAIGSPVWLWGHMYERIVNSILQGTYDAEKGQAVNYWWGMESQASDILLSDELPESMQFLANLLRTGFIKGKLDPFYRKIVAQNGTVVNDGTRHFTVEELLRMDWLCENIDGYIPEYEEVLPYAQPMMKALGLHKERIPVEKDDIV